MTETIKFFNARNEAVVLQSTYADILWGLTGRFHPKVTFIEEETAERDGARIRRVKIPPREVAIPVLFHAANATGLRTRMRTTVRRFYPLADGRLQVTAPDGQVRELVCRYSQGLEGEESKEAGGEIAMKAVLVFRAAEDPFWRAATKTILDFITGEPPSWFPLFPLRLGSSSVFGGITVDNVGDVQAWPIWRITGPGGPLTLINDTTGEQLNLSTVLVGGETITIDTTPGVKTILRNDGSNLYPDLGGHRDLWALDPGENEIRVELADTTADSRVRLTYRPRYLTP